MGIKLLFVIDMQNDFIDGALGTPEAREIVPNVIAKINNFMEQHPIGKRRIILSRDTHYENYLSTQEGMKLPVEHCIEGTYGWEVNAVVANTAIDSESAWFYDKKSFGDVNWEKFLNNFTGVNTKDIESIEIVGLCTDICVISNAMILKALFPEVPITVDSSCCAGVTPESHRNALEAMKMCQINVI